MTEKMFPSISAIGFYVACAKLLLNITFDLYLVQALPNCERSGWEADADSGK